MEATTLRQFADLPELERLTADERQSVLEEAVRVVTVTHGRMSNVPHYIGCGLAMLAISPLAMTGKGILVSVLAGALAYSGPLAIDVFLWRRSMARAFRTSVRQIIAARGSAGS